MAGVFQGHRPPPLTTANNVPGAVCSQDDGQSLLTAVEGVVSFGTPFGTCPIRIDAIWHSSRGKKCTEPAADAKLAKSWTEELPTTGR